jgi:signal transduction histidine kinase/ligand-binding sensor domain-containing protein
MQPADAMVCGLETGVYKEGSVFGVSHRQALGVGVLAAAVLLGAGRAQALDPAKPLSACTAQTWRSRDGVPGWVRAIAQTAEGYLWIGTSAGLSRYGGGRVVSLVPEPAFARAGDVMGLWAARDGTLWVAPARGDPVCVRGGVMTDCLPPGQHLEASARITDLTQDRDGAMWMTTAAGIYRFRDGQLALVHPAGRLPFQRPQVVHRDARGRLWVGAASGLWADSGGSFVRHDAHDTGFVTAFHETPQGRLWVATEHGLLRIEGGAGTLYGAAGGFPAGRPTQVIEDRDGNVWFGGRSGLTRFRPAVGFAGHGRLDGAPDADVTAVFEDREGSLWVGSRGGGLSQFTDRTVDGQAGPPSLRERWVNTVAEDAAGGLWVGSRAGLTRWQDGRELSYTRADGLPADNVQSVFPGRDGELWVGTEGGLARWRPQAGGGGRLDTPVPFTGPVPSLYLDAQDTLWIGSVGALARTDTRALAAGAPAAVEKLAVEPGLDLTEVRGIQHDDRGVLWLSAGGKLAQLVDGRVRLPSDPAAAEAARVGRVRSLYRDADGTLWLGTYDGLLRNRGGRWRLFAAGPGHLPEDLYQVLADDRGHLWAGSSVGIVRVSKRALDELEAGRRHLLDTVSFPASGQHRDVDAMRPRQPGAWKTRDGQLWFAAARGLVRIDPAHVRINTQAPAVLVEQALVDGRPAQRGVPNAFPPGSGALEFHFAGITLLEPHKAMHRYRLEGFEPGWVEAGNRRVAYYTNIPPGRYRFRVQASNADGVWNEAGDTVELTLAPHFFQTWWFAGLCALGLLGLVVAFHRMRVAQVHSRYAATFAERNRVARELHDSLLQGMSAALLHIGGVRKRLARTGPRLEPQAVDGELARIEHLMSSNMEDTRRYVWDLRESTADAPLPIEPALGQLVRRVTQGLPIEVRVEAEGAATPLPAHISRELLRIVQEALSNALKHAQAAHIEVRLCYDHDSVRLSVRDDGRGFDPQVAPGTTAGHFGLAGMRERAAAIGALAVESVPGRGTKVEVTIPRQELRARDL